MKVKVFNQYLFSYSGELIKIRSLLFFFLIMKKVDSRRKKEISEMKKPKYILNTYFESVAGFMVRFCISILRKN
jgi:hypothetical protein